MAAKNSAKLDDQANDNDALLLRHSLESVQENESAFQTDTRSMSPEGGQLKHAKTTLHGMALGPQDEDATSHEPKGVAVEAATVEDNGREKLKRHRVEVAGRVWIPDIWGQEDLLKDWIDCSVFEASLASSGIMSARAALVDEGKRTHSTSLRI